MNMVDNSIELSLNLSNTKNHDNKFDLTDLPTEIFFLICSYITPQDTIICRRVSRLWFRVFTNADTSWSFMKLYFPRSREMRRVAEESEPEPDEKPNWTRIFANVAERYYYLRSAKPRSIEKLDITQDLYPVGCFLWGVLWNYEYANFQHNEPSWTMDGELLVYEDHITRQPVVYDLETKNRVSVPFVVEEMIIRRMRLACGVLIIEWCEGEPWKILGSKMLFRHYVTAFDLDRRPCSNTAASSSSIKFTLDITFRSEWRIYPPGFTTGSDYQFFSAHTSTHYALYLYIRDCSEHPPRHHQEYLTIWDISKPSSYRASIELTEIDKPRPGSSEEGPTIINEFSRDDLDFLGVRQGEAPVLFKILIDDTNVYFQEEDHCWVPDDERIPPRHHEVRCTGFPFSGIGPRWVDECCTDGSVFMNFCPRAGSLSRALGNRPLGFGGGKSKSWPGWAPCWRHEEFPYLTVSDMVDYDAGVRVVARRCHMIDTLSAFTPPKICIQEERNGGSEVEEQDRRFEDEMWKELLGRGKIVGDERWIVGEDSDGKITILRF
ncbi:uncharacterized protein GGS22DRAFT_168615 [Annulohypoxylon maeteangense]|uniref:uncharacterized protein n=1 Tax=Annulohypoxylon maeteangense TaxID=1927788 RepID=UPI0020072C54|nr:uncharacterized protein GGS22DRAFT_168615 [Annulohypoxylon maeteangense]KAI0882743.1 hypothetical protein GGS22DRAFT_168615 [Annulohypoxylon maeteangense]